MIQLYILFLPVSLISVVIVFSKYHKFSSLPLQILLIFLSIYPVVYTFDLSMHYLPFFDGSLKAFTAEPVYKTSIEYLRIAGLSSKAILLSHVLMCIVINNSSFKILRSIGIFPERVLSLWQLMFWSMPGIIATYLSPRSGIGFTLAFFGFSLFLLSFKPTLSLFVLVSLRLGSSIFLIMGCILHYQYLLVGVTLLLVALAYSLNFLYFQNLFSKTPRLFIVVGLIIGIFLVYVVALSGNFLTYLPDTDLLSSGYASAKFSRINADSGVRYTSFFSLLAPFVLVEYYLRNSLILEVRGVRHAFLALMYLGFFGVIIVVMFWGNPHFAGRLARFSDYIIIPLAMVLVLNRIRHIRIKLIVAALMMVSIVFAYPSAYLFVS